MAGGDMKHLWGGFWATSLGTLASRVLGLARDMATAALLGLGEGGVMDALVVAFRVPNLFRRIFGEGALAASFLPVFSAVHQRDPRQAWQLVSALFTLLTLGLGSLVLAGEVACAAILWAVRRDDAATWQLIGLTAALLPYMVLICLAAQASATLQALLRFRAAAVAPMLLNVLWLAAVWLVAPWFATDKLAQAYVIAAAILLSGVLQFGVQLPALWGLGFRFDVNWSATRESVWKIGRTMLPITLGLAVTQLNTLMDSLIAWGLSAPRGASQTIAWLGDAAPYPMESGAAAAVYYGERFYQLPVGILGVAIATVIYPLLSRHAARGDRDRVGRDLSLGLRLVWFTALPAGVGIMLVAQPLTRVLFERGAFTSDDAARAARMIAGYASGVWAYCAIPVLVRGYYAVGDALTPARVGLVAVAANLALNLTLIWPFAELGLAVSTSIAAGLQVVLLTVGFSRRASRLAWSELMSTVIRSALAVAVMSLAVLAVDHFFPPAADASRTRQAIQLALAIALGATTYAGTARLLRMSELRLLLRRPVDN
jgi:putative peptidoglycan lipid II flippase